MGSGHSSTPILEPDDRLVDLAALCHVNDQDPDAREAIVEVTLAYEDGLEAAPTGSRSRHGG